MAAPVAAAERGGREGGRLVYAMVDFRKGDEDRMDGGRRTQGGRKGYFGLKCYILASISVMQSSSGIFSKEGNWSGISLNRQNCSGIYLINPKFYVLLILILML